jgi:hypothetical protein
MSSPRTAFSVGACLAGLALGLASTMSLPAGAGAGDEGGRAALEQRFRALDPADATSAYKLALELESAGAKDLAAKAYEIVIGIEPDHRAARRALGYEEIDARWLRGDDLQRAKGFVNHEGTWMTGQEFAAATRPQREAADQKRGEKRVLSLLAKIASEEPEKVAKARREMAGIDARYKLAPLALALRAEPASLRIYAAEELGRLADPLGVPPLLKRAIYDDDKDVRTAVALALKEIGSPSTVFPLGRALDSRSSDVRVRAAEALGLLGDELAYPFVIKKWEGRAGDFPRVYFSTVKQVSYIQDFDVEVAQTSFIADPIVGVLQEGVVQSVKIHATEQTFMIYERPAFNGALAQLAGTDLGNKLGAWKSFWLENKDRLLDERAARYRALAAERKKAAEERARVEATSTPLEDR